MWKRSFIKLDHEEDEAFRSYILRSHQDGLAYPAAGEADYLSEYTLFHETIARKLKLDDYDLKITQLLVKGRDTKETLVPGPLAMKGGIIYRLLPIELIIKEK
ncbi:MAG: hypothetical protein RR588_16735, partial [Solibacillus sp.]